MVDKAENSQKVQLIFYGEHWNTAKRNGALRYFKRCCVIGLKVVKQYGTE